MILSPSCYHRQAKATDRFIWILEGLDWEDDVVEGLLEEVKQAGAQEELEKRNSKLGICRWEPNQEIKVSVFD